ncbi:MAG: hypothetical protein ACQEP1_03215 [Nanobdellota archaeon]
MSKEDEYEDMTENFIEVQEDPKMDVKFYKVSENLETKEITRGLKKGNEIQIINLEPLMDDPATLRVFINKIRRISDQYSITMKIYGKHWLLILPENVTFEMGEE